MEVLSTDTVLFEREVRHEYMYDFTEARTIMAPAWESKREYFVSRFIIEVSVSVENPEAIMEIRHFLDMHGCRYGMKSAFDHSYHSYYDFTSPWERRHAPPQIHRVELDVQNGRIPTSLLRKYKDSINYILLDTRTYGRQEEFLRQYRSTWEPGPRFINKSFIVYPHRKGEDISFLYTDRETTQRLYTSIFGFETNKESVKELKLERFED